MQLNTLILSVIEANVLHKCRPKTHATGNQKGRIFWVNSKFSNGETFLIYKPQNEMYTNIKTSCTFCAQKIKKPSLLTRL